jgi:PTS system glucitol/sorbitol-specific IIA component
MTGGAGEPEPQTLEATHDDVLYATTVTAVGEMVDDFRRQGVVILFGEQAPEELWEFSVRHRPTVTPDGVAAGPRPGDVLDLHGVRLPVLAVGAVVADNLVNLGHLDIKADGRTEAALPGDLCVPEGELPPLHEGAVIRILRPNGSANGVAP